MDDHLWPVCSQLDREGSDCRALLGYLPKLPNSKYLVSISV